MAALTRSARVRVRGAMPGEGAAIAVLWRELWDAHEGWGGYPGSRDPRVYAQLAHRLDDDARVRGGQPILGRHVHLVADLGGAPCGQVEGWFERHGVDGATPFTCEVRSLIVSDSARGLGAGRALLEALAGSARVLSRGAPCVLAAEVLEPNPAQTFYARVGYAPVAWNARIEAEHGAAAPASGRVTARVALAQDALAIARLEATLAARRRAAGDIRFDRPRAIDATMVGAIAAHLAGDAGGSLHDPATLVAVDAAGLVRAVASFTVHALEPPFVPIRRALIGRFAVDPASPALPYVAPLAALGCRLAVAQGAPHVELTDLSAPGTELHAAALATGATAWSRVVTRSV
ncbi:MAG TPA: GNAT family N-acetyltransferase [Polyangiaceae bacterium]